MAVTGGIAIAAAVGSMFVQNKQQKIAEQKQTDLVNANKAEQDRLMKAQKDKEAQLTAQAFTNNSANRTSAPTLPGSPPGSIGAPGNPAAASKTLIGS